MPKKHTPGFKTAKPQAAPHSSLASRAETAGDSHARPKTVNERLQELRVSQSSRTSASGPGVLTPLPEQGDAQRQRRSHNLVAGPPPPRSWTSPRSIDRNRQPQSLEASRHAPVTTQARNKTDSHRLQLPPPVMPGQPLPQARSLRATALRSLAMNLSWHIAYQQEWLDYVLTTRIKSELVGMIALWPIDSPHRLNKRNMRYLFGPQQDPSGRWYSGGEGVTHLSFGAELDQQRDYMNLARYLRQESSDMDNPVPDNWDEANMLENTSRHQWSDSSSSVSDQDTDTEEQMTIQAPPPTLPFLPSLTHLSLARSSFACWSSLIEIGSLDALCHLTHLDLSYWPSPTLVAAMHNSSLPLLHTESVMVGTRDRQQEVIRVFNQLGKSCRKLVWLGLEGCETWIPSLMKILPKTTQSSRSRYDIAGGPPQAMFTRVDWTGVWRGLEVLKVAQSWIPKAFIDQEKMDENTSDKWYMNPTSTFPDWWGKELSRHVEEMQIAQYRRDAKQPVLKFEKSPVQSWVELEIRSSTYQGPSKRWRDSPLMQPGIVWENGL